MLTLWCSDLAKSFLPRLRLDDLLRLRLRPNESPTLALDGVSFSVDEGEIVALLGANGAGKTTLLKVVATLVVPDRGEAVVAGHALSNENDVRRSIGLVTSEERSFYWRLTGRENLSFFGAMQGLPPRQVEERIRQLCSAFDLQPFIDRRFDACSSGMKQRLALARALLHRPRLLLLDEPTRSVDPIESQALHAAILDLVREEGTAVLLVTHNLAEAQKLCSRFLVMQAGRLAFDGSPSELGQLIGAGATLARYTLFVEGSARSWEKTHGSATADLVRSGNPSELSVELEPETAIGDVVTEIHAKGGRVLDIQPQGGNIERALHAAGTGSHAASRPLPPRPSIVSAPRPAEPRLLQFQAFLRRDLRLHLSYRFAFALGFIGIIFNVAVFFFLARLVTEAGVPALQQYGGDFFPFILIGIAFRGYLGVALNHFASSLRSEQMMGTLEMLLASPLRLSTLVGATTSFTFVYHTATVAGYLLLGLLIGSLSLGRMNLPVAFLVMIPTVVSFAALGMLSASFMMTVKRGDPVNFLINATATLFGGVYFPVEVLPDSLRIVSRALPITYSLDGMRKALLTRAGASEVATELVVLTAFAVLLLPIGLLVFRHALRQARREGTLGQF
ncbi:MAG: ABC transporter ATP-binding protein/permease [Vicinamibacteria bacterium]